MSPTRQTFPSAADFVIGVLNVAPTITTLTSSKPDLANKSDDGAVTIAGSFFEAAGSLDTHTDSTVNWGDGTATDLLIVNQSADTFSGAHNYATGGIYTITVTVNNEDRGVSSEVTTTALVTGVGLVGDVFYVIGTSDKHQVQLSRDGNQIKVQAQLDDGNIDLERFFVTANVTEIFIATCEQEDQIQIASEITLPTFIDAGDGKDQVQSGDGDTTVYGGGGDDQIQTGAGNDVVLGGNGNDVMYAGTGRNLLVGGRRADEVIGGSEDDILVGGYLHFGASLDSAIMAEWTSERDYATRVANLNGTGSGARANGNYFLSTATMHDDDHKDKMSGNQRPRIVDLYCGRWNRINFGSG